MFLVWLYYSVICCFISTQVARQCTYCVPFACTACNIFVGYFGFTIMIAYLEDIIIQTQIITK